VVGFVFLHFMPNQTAIITGASSGIGKELAYQLAAMNWNVFLIARRDALLSGIVEDINRLSQGKADWYACDVSDEAEVTRAVKKADNSLGSISLVIANAGAQKQVSIHDLDIEAIWRIYEVNVFGTLNTVKASLPYLKERGAGQIIAVSSISSFCSLPKGHPYCASKAALNRHMRGIYYELKHKNIAVTTVLLGFVKTSFIAHHPFKVPVAVKAKDAARKIIRIVGSKRKTVFINALPLLCFIRIMNLLPEQFHYRLFKTTKLA
jgi:hypothetical protein